MKKMNTLAHSFRLHFVQKEEIYLRHFQLKFITNAATIRWLTILKLFERKNRCSAAELAAETKSTTRTITTDINDIATYFEKAIQIDSSYQGYHFTIHKQEEYLEAKHRLISQEIPFHIIESIFSNRLCSLESWAEEFHVSESTIFRYLRKMQAVLNDYELKISSNPVTLIGLEMNIRKFALDFYYESEITSQSVTPPIAIHDITVQFFKDYPELHHTCSLGEFNYFLWISLERFEAGHTIHLAQTVKDLYGHSKEFRMFSKINDTIKTYYQTEFPFEELLYLFLLIISRRSLMQIKKEKQFCQQYNYWSEIKLLSREFVTLYLSETNHWSREDTLIESFFTVAKIKQMLSPILNHHLYDLTLYVRHNYPNDLQDFQKFLQTHPSAATIWDEQTIEHLAVSLTLHVQTLKATYWSETKKIAFLFEGSYFLGQFIKSSITKYASQQVELYFPTLLEFSPEYLINHQIDLVITNFTEYNSDYLDTVEVFPLKTYPTQEDWQKLLHTIQPFHSSITVERP